MTEEIKTRSVLSEVQRVTEFCQKEGIDMTPAELGSALIIAQLALMYVHNLKQGAVAEVEEQRLSDDLDQIIKNLDLSIRATIEYNRLKKETVN